MTGIPPGGENRSESPVTLLRELNAVTIREELQVPEREVSPGCQGFCSGGPDNDGRSVAVSVNPISRMNTRRNGLDCATSPTAPSAVVVKDQPLAHQLYQFALAFFSDSRHVEMCSEARAWT